MSHWVILLTLLSTAVFTRVAVSLYPYSGAGKPPMFGDYEAQRHWMEITYNLPLEQWYVNSSSNPLNYWGLDYPPLTAYHSWLLGAAAAFISPDWISLPESRGFESSSHKLFMRYSVLLTDLLLYFTAVVTFVNYLVKNSFVSYPSQSKVTLKCCWIFLILMQPSLVLVDHGHFQYNSVSLGLALWGVMAVITDWDMLGSVAFCLALNYKQMELYHSLPFFCYLLGKALRLKRDWRGALSHVVKLGVAVVFSFALCWTPFYLRGGRPGVAQVLARVFPFNRGLYEDKVASVWCSVSVLVKVRSFLSTQVLMWLSSVATLAAALPSLLPLLLDPSPYRFLLGLVTTSLSFFLFSFHVHEKTILLVVLPVSLLLGLHPHTFVWFNVLAAFSMYPLLSREGLALAVWGSTGLFSVAALLVLHYYSSSTLAWHTAASLVSSVYGLLGLCLLSHLLPPPASLPDIFPVLISCCSCLLLVGTWLYFSHIQLSLPLGMGATPPLSASWTLPPPHTANTAAKSHKKKQ